MFHPPAPPPHHLPPPPHRAPPPHHAPPPHYPPPPQYAPPPHYAPPQPHAGPSNPRPHHYPHTPPNMTPRIHHYPQTPPAMTPRLQHMAPSPIHVTPRPYNPPPPHHFPRAGPSQPHRPNLPPQPHSAPAKMDYPPWNASYSPSVLEPVYPVDQASPTRSMYDSKNILPRISMSTAPSNGSLNGTAVSPHLMAYNWGPAEGGPGSQLIIKVDVNGESMPNSSVHNDRLRIVIGDTPLSTFAKNIGSDRCRIPGGTVQMLSCFIPESGQGLVYRLFDTVPVYIQLVDGQNQTIEMLHIGEYTFAGPGNGCAPNVQATYGVKREASEYMESGRDNQWNQHRRSVSASLSVPYEAGLYSGAPSPQMSSMPPWGPHGFAASIHMMANQQGYDPSCHGMNPCPQPALTRSTQLGPHTNFYDAPKADIFIAGDMNTMAKGWASEEWTAKRRLVKVWRRQEGHSIFLAFASMTQAQWQNEKDCVVVSCMFREDKNSCWITSVDMLYLLEAVIGQRFSVEEKNRIRRNLEGFRPQTVSKNKPGSDAFFRTIMNYPNPKPRNIEKDVKVFPWEAVSGSIKKIVSKYTATVGPGGEPILYHPPSGEGGQTIPLPRVNDQYSGAGNGRAVSYGESSVFAGSTNESMPNMSSGMSSSMSHFPIDPTLMNMPHPQSVNMMSMHAGPSGSQTFDQSYPPPRATGMNPNANWDQTIDGYRNYPSPPGLSYSHSSTATALTEYPSSPHGYYSNPPMNASAPTTSSSNPTGQGPSDQSGSPPKASLEVNVSTHQSPSEAFWQNSPYVLDAGVTSFDSQTYDDYKVNMPSDVVGSYSNPVYTETSLV